MQNCLSFLFKVGQKNSQSKGLSTNHPLYRHILFNSCYLVFWTFEQTPSPSFVHVVCTRPISSKWACSSPFFHLFHEKNIKTWFQKPISRVRKWYDYDNISFSIIWVSTLNNKWIPRSWISCFSKFLLVTSGTMGGPNQCCCNSNSILLLRWTNPICSKQCNVYFLPKFCSFHPLLLKGLSINHIVNLWVFSPSPLRGCFY